MKIGFTASAFDLLHAGHISMLKEAKEHCDYLICGLHVNPRIEREYKNKPIQSLIERYIQLFGCKYVNEIIPYETEQDLCDILMAFPINIRFIGEEYKDTEYTGKGICDTRGISIHYNKRDHKFSTTELRHRVENHGKNSINTECGITVSMDNVNIEWPKIPENNIIDAYT